MKCPICGNDIPSTYCEFCNTNLIQINGEWYSETLYKAVPDLITALNSSREIKNTMIAQAAQALTPNFIAFKNHPNYYGELENIIIEYIRVINNLDVMRENTSKVLYDDYYSYAMKTMDPLFGDTEKMMIEIFDNIDNIFDNIKVVFSRIFEILRNDSKAQSLFIKHDIQRILDDEERKIENRKELEINRISTSYQQEFKTEVTHSSEERINFNKTRKLDL